MPGVTVYERRNKTGTVYVGRYTLPSKQRVPMPAEATWEEAFAKAAAEQQKVDRNRHRVVRNGRITFNELVDVHWMPTLGRISPNTRKNHAWSAPAPQPDLVVVAEPLLVTGLLDAHSDVGFDAVQLRQAPYPGSAEQCGMRCYPQPSRGDVTTLDVTAVTLDHAQTSPIRGNS
ncbi:MAG TPA: hypothetical protein VNA20_08645 [Frankiaceae bacterium]|nr:hypothetical protein [Frankiaceae bacterium]